MQHFLADAAQKIQWFMKEIHQEDVDTDINNMDMDTDTEMEITAMENITRIFTAKIQDN